MCWYKDAALQLLKGFALNIQHVAECEIDLMHDTFHKLNTGGV
jgi:hypothetical protein